MIRGPELRIEHVTATYRRHPAVHHVSARFAPGSLTAIVGPNGAGKSTALSAALGMIPVAGGSAAFWGQPFAQMRRRVAFLPQRAGVDWDFPVRVADVVAMGLWHDLGLFGRMGPAARARVADALARTGMADLARRPIGALSGGQQQRVFLARALAQEADLFILDEPFAGVDAASEEAIMAVLSGLRAAGRTVIAVHHDIGGLAGRFDRVLLMNRRRIAEGPLPGTLTAATLAQAYGRLVPVMAAE